jgi:hypothetical protein
VDDGGPAGCLDDSAVVALLTGEVDAARRAAMVDHADGCDRCRALLGAAVVAARRAPTPPAATTATTDVVDPGAALHAPTEPMAAPLMPGAHVGRYRILGPLGRGGMASVFRAHDPELAREVAVKMVATGTAPGSRADERLQREAQALAQLAHPNVVRVFDVGSHGAAVFVAMELLGGPTLQAWQQAERPSSQRVLAVLVDVGRGLAAAHRAGLVHRDVKPSNVIVVDGDQPRLIDFGLARIAIQPPGAIDDGGGSDLAATALTAALTEAHSIVGTPAYMAPEQHRGGAVTAAADQFSFCVVAYEMLYGERPFAGETRGALRAAVLAGALRPPPVRHAAGRRVARALVRGLALDPAARFPAMDALLAELAPRRGRRTAVAALALGGLAAFAGIAALGGAPPPVCADDAAALSGAWDAAADAAVRAGLRASGSPRAADTEPRVIAGLDAYARGWRAARVAACRATHVEHTQSAALLDQRMACLDRRRAALAALGAELARADAAVVDQAVQAVAALPALEACAERAALAAPTPTSPEARAVADDLARAASLRTTGQYQRGLALATTLAGRAAGEPALAAAARYELGALHAAAGDTGAADRELEAAVAAAGRAGDDTVLARSLVELVAVRGVDAARLEAGRALGVAADAAIARAGEPWRLRAQLEANLGNLATDQGDFAAARDRHRRAHALFVAHGAGDQAGADSALGNLGNALDGLGDADGAITAHEQSLAMRRRLYGDRHPHVAASLSNLAAAVRRRDPARAVTLLEEALVVAGETVGERHVGFAIVLANLGNALRDLGRTGEARARYSAAIEVAGVALSPDHPLIAQLRVQRGQAALTDGDRDAARTDLEAAVATFATADTDPHAAAEARFGLATVLGVRVARARALAAQARAAYAGDLAPAAKAAVAEIDAWLAAR